MHFPTTAWLDYTIKQSCSNFYTSIDYVGVTVRTPSTPSFFFIPYFLSGVVDVAAWHERFVYSRRSRARYHSFKVHSKNHIASSPLIYYFFDMTPFLLQPSIKLFYNIIYCRLFLFLHFLLRFVIVQIENAHENTCILIDWFNRAQKSLLLYLSGISCSIHASQFISSAA